MQLDTAQHVKVGGRLTLVCDSVQGSSWADVTFVAPERAKESTHHWGALQAGSRRWQTDGAHSLGSSNNCLGCTSPQNTSASKLAPSCCKNPVCSMCAHDGTSASTGGRYCILAALQLCRSLYAMQNAVFNDVP